MEIFFKLFYTIKNIENIYGEIYVISQLVNIYTVINLKPICD